MRSEAAYQSKLISKLSNMFPGCFIMKTNPAEYQGIPDLIILFGGTWAMLELKRHSNAERQANQNYYVEKFNEMAFAAFIHPQNEDQVLSDLQSAFGVGREACLS